MVIFMTLFTVTILLQLHKLLARLDNKFNMEQKSSIPQAIRITDQGDDYIKSPGYADHFEM